MLPTHFAIDDLACPSEKYAIAIKRHNAHFLKREPMLFNRVTRKSAETGHAPQTARNIFLIQWDREPLTASSYDTLPADALYAPAV